MIEKLKIPKNINWDDTPDNLIKRHLLITGAYKKINELVDAVNKIMTWRFETDDEPAETPIISKMENVDPYAEQRKWIGKLCRFWDNDSSGVFFDTLKSPLVNGTFQAPSGTWQHCEPIKSDDPIIYKGE